MTVITETRWKCDWCDTVSPVIVRQDFVFGAPSGWVRQEVKSNGRDLDDMGRALRHFCCEAHKKAWIAEPPEWVRP